MMYAKITNGNLVVAKIIHDSNGVHDANAQNPVVPAGWQLVQDSVNVDSVDVNGFPVLSRRQLRLTMLSIGVTSTAVEAVIAQISDAADRESARIYWEDTTKYSRDHPLISQIATALSVSNEQLDAAWMSGPAIDGET